MTQKAISGPFFFATAGAAGGRLVRQKQGQYLFERALGVRHVAGRRIPDPGAICPLAKRMRPLLIPPDTGQQLDQEVDPRSVHALAHVVGSGIMRRPGAYRALDPEIGQGGAHDPGPQLFLAPPQRFGVQIADRLARVMPFPLVQDGFSYSPGFTPLQAAVRTHPNLVEFCRRIECRAWTAPPGPAPVSRESAATTV